MPSDKRHTRRWRETIVPRVIRRDGGICWICGQPGAGTADHVIPLAQGGTDDPTNLAAAHHVNPPHCNRVKGHGTLTRARERLGLSQTTNEAWDW